MIGSIGRTLNWISLRSKVSVADPMKVTLVRATKDPSDARRLNSDSAVTVASPRRAIAMKPNNIKSRKDGIGIRNNSDDTE